MNIVNFLHDLTSAIDKYNLDFDAFSYGQLESKQWLIDEVVACQLSLGSVFNLCGWYGILPAMMFYYQLDLTKIRSFDIDEACVPIADQMNKTYIKDGWKFKAICEDINNINFHRHFWEGYSNVSKKYIKVADIPETIINTSCEHTDTYWFERVPEGKLLILQSNNYLEGTGHVNCCSDFMEFDTKYPLSTVFYYGQRNFEKYDRFMKIGVK